MIINGVTVKNKTVAGELVKYLLSMGQYAGLSLERGSRKREAGDESGPS